MLLLGLLYGRGWLFRQHRAPFNDVFWPYICWKISRKQLNNQFWLSLAPRCGGVPYNESWNMLVPVVTSEQAFLHNPFSYCGENWDSERVAVTSQCDDMFCQHWRTNSIMTWSGHCPNMHWLDACKSATLGRLYVIRLAYCTGHKQWSMYIISEWAERWLKGKSHIYM